ncbi:hypothetical protein EYC84_004687 [Monilinia fructicola]|uniref:Uncharacterized protein n=1 Tax=Monilinia fructicola TaxID=38448 RepID=A0A5M9K9H9_MONFR|nr:hypothetical protein EYC84_004687 [Monilinia fructicola]
MVDKAFVTFGSPCIINSTHQPPPQFLDTGTRSGSPPQSQVQPPPTPKANIQNQHPNKPHQCRVLHPFLLLKPRSNRYQAPSSKPAAYRK